MYRAVVLGVESEGNAGFLARLAENFDIDELCFVEPECGFGEEAERTASHATATLKSARVLDELGKAVEDLDYLVGTTGVVTSEDNVLRYGASPRQMVEDLPEDADIGVLLGPEGKGLSNEELELCDFVVSIPASEDYPVMNLSHAAAVIFYELYNAGETDSRPSAREKREVLENLFKGITESLGWEGARVDRTLRAFRNVLGRAYLTDRETQLLLGAFRETREKLGAE